jgi:Flp pilus assembly protein TadG
MKGQTLPLMAILLAVVMLFMVCLLDVGRVYVWRTQVQRAADAAALAGASGYVDGDALGDSVRARARDYARRNTVGGAPAVVGAVTLTLDSALVAVRIDYHTPALLFMPRGGRLSAWATAHAGRPAVGSNLGRPVPRGNAYGWWEQNRVVGGADSVVLQLIR